MKSFNQKLVTGVSSLVVFVLPLFIGAWLALRQIIADHNELISTYAQELLLTKDLRLDVTQARAAMPAYVFSGEAMLLRQFEFANRNFAVHLAELNRLITDLDDRKILEKIAAGQAAMERLAVPGIALRQNGHSALEVHRYFLKNTRSQAYDLDRALGDFSVHASAAFEEAKADSRSETTRILNGLAIASVLTLLLFSVTAGLLLLMAHRKKAHDETTEQLLKRERELSQARKETVEVVAHDLKSPLTSIIMSTELALDEWKTDPELGASLAITLRSAQSMKRLIDDLLDHSKIEAGSLTLNRAECSLARLLQGLSERFQPIADYKGVALKLEVMGDLPLMQLDEGRMEQVISNFLCNSIKFTPSRGWIRLSGEVRDRQVLISVRDNGCGMTPDQASHVFERYWQVRTSNAANGNGLGLAISKAIIEAHEGKVSVWSQPGEGAAFTLSLPLTPAAPIPSSEPRRKTQASVFSTLTA